MSIEESLQERFRINVGDQMRFDVLGRTIPARVTSIRNVNWRDYRSGGFMFVFRPGPFENAPHTYISSVQRPARRRLRAPGCRRRSSSRYPNVSVIDLREVLDTIQGDRRRRHARRDRRRRRWCCSRGLLILVGAVSMTKFQRVYEAAILKTLGASSRLIATMLLLEYGVLGAIAGTVGRPRRDRPDLGGRAVRAGPCRGTPRPLITIVGIAATAVLVAAIGVLASLDVLRHKPLATLRAE